MDHFPSGEWITFRAARPLWATGSKRTPVLVWTLQWEWFKSWGFPLNRSDVFTFVFTSRRRRDQRDAKLLIKLEAPPGFEPGVEVLQTGSRNTNLLTRLDFWSALIPRFTPFSAGSVPRLFPSRFFP